MKKYAPMVVRVGIALVVLWFGIQQILHPESWVLLLPEWTSMSGLSPVTLIYLNGAFEFVSGLALLFGFYTRWVALAVALHLADIAYTVGYNDVFVRDIGLTFSALSTFLNGADEWTLDYKFKENPDGF
jgi:uncharacterized membrane protein YphA (DoxX/SURF4 family)